MAQADPDRIHELEYDLGFRCDPPTHRRAPHTALSAALSAALGEVWTPDYVESLTGPDTTLVEHGPLEWLISTKDGERHHCSVVRLEAGAIDALGVEAFLSVAFAEMESALAAHREHVMVA